MTTDNDIVALLVWFWEYVKKILLQVLDKLSGNDNWDDEGDYYGNER